jgi:hypothetical protein
MEEDIKSYRCCECDYRGKDAIFDEEDCEYKCPHCGESCMEVEDMTAEQDEKLENFFKNNKFIVSPDKPNEDSNYKFIWDDYDLLKLKESKHEKLYYCTLVDCEDDEAWISSGIHFVNRVGYLISETEIQELEDGIRYW